MFDVLITLLDTGYSQMQRFIMYLWHNVRFKIQGYLLNVSYDQLMIMK